MPALCQEATTKRQRNIYDVKMVKGNKEQKVMNQVDGSNLQGYSCIYRDQDDRLDRGLSNGAAVCFTLFSTLTTILPTPISHYLIWNPEQAEQWKSAVCSRLATRELQLSTPSTSAKGIFYPSQLFCESMGTGIIPLQSYPNVV